MKPLWLEITLEDKTILPSLFSSHYIWTSLCRSNYWYLKIYGLWMNSLLNIIFPLIIILVINFMVYRWDYSWQETSIYDYLLEPFFRKLIEHAAQNILYQSPERKTNIRLQQEVNPKANTTYYNSIIQYIHPYCILHTHNSSLGWYFAQSPLKHLTLFLPD